MIWAAIIGVTLLALVVWSRVQSARIGREKANGTYARQFIHVNEDGTVRELTGDEIKHLNTEYEVLDGARPYIKSRYKQRTPDGKIWGYLRRRKLPLGTRINSN